MCRQITRWGLVLSVYGVSHRHPSSISPPLLEQLAFPETREVCRDWLAARRSRELILGMWGTPTPPYLGLHFPGEGVGNLGLPPPPRKDTPHVLLTRLISIFMKVVMIMNMLIRHYWLLQVPLPSLLYSPALLLPQAALFSLIPLALNSLTHPGPASQPFPRLSHLLPPISVPLPSLPSFFTWAAVTLFRA